MIIKLTNCFSYDLASFFNNHFYLMSLVIHCIGRSETAQIIRYQNKINNNNILQINK